MSTRKSVYEIVLYLHLNHDLHIQPLEGEELRLNVLLKEKTS